MLQRSQLKLKLGGSSLSQSPGFAVSDLASIASPEMVGGEMFTGGGGGGPSVTGPTGAEGTNCSPSEVPFARTRIIKPRSACVSVYWRPPLPVTMSAQSGSLWSVLSPQAAVTGSQVCHLYTPV